MRLRIISGNTNKAIADQISEHIGIGLTKRVLKKFMDGEMYAQILENVRGDDVFVIQSVSDPVNDSLMELLILIDALKRASAARITAVITYYGYARQDRKAGPREPITAKLVADLITKAGADRILAIDLHVPQIQGFFDIPVDEISAIPLFAKYLLAKGLDDMVVVAPDAGSAKRARSLAKRLDCPIAIIDKRRVMHNDSEIVHIVGDIAGKNAILIDDIIDTGNSITKAADELAKTAKCVFVCATHPVFSDGCQAKLEACSAVEVIVTNTISPDSLSSGKIKIISLGMFLSQVINNINQNRSVSDLFS